VRRRKKITNFRTYISSEVNNDDNNCPNAYGNSKIFPPDATTEVSTYNSFCVIPTNSIEFQESCDTLLTRIFDSGQSDGLVYNGRLKLLISAPPIFRDAVKTENITSGGKTYVYETPDQTELRVDRVDGLDFGPIGRYKLVRSRFLVCKDSDAEDLVYYISVGGGLTRISQESDVSIGISDLSEATIFACSSDGKKRILADSNKIYTFHNNEVTSFEVKSHTDEIAVNTSGIILVRSGDVLVRYGDTQVNYNVENYSNLFSIGEDFFMWKTNILQKINIDGNISPASESVKDTYSHMQFTTSNKGWAVNHTTGTICSFVLNNGSWLWKDRIGLRRNLTSDICMIALDNDRVVYITNRSLDILRFNQYSLYQYTSSYADILSLLQFYTGSTVFQPPLTLSFLDTGELLVRRGSSGEILFSSNTSDNTIHDVKYTPFVEIQSLTQSYTTKNGRYIFDVEGVHINLIHDPNYRTFAKKNVNTSKNALEMYCFKNTSDPRCRCTRRDDLITSLFGNILNLQNNTQLLTRLRDNAPCLDGTCRSYGRESTYLASTFPSCGQSEESLVLCNQYITTGGSSIGTTAAISQNCGSNDLLPCTNNSCPIGSTCTKGICRRICASNIDCVDGGTCADGACVRTNNKTGYIVGIVVLCISFLILLAVLLWINSKK
jgi:hypothetical protein